MVTTEYLEMSLIKKKYITISANVPEGLVPLWPQVIRFTLQALYC